MKNPCHANYCHKPWLSDKAKILAHIFSDCLFDESSEYIIMNNTVLSKPLLVNLQPPSPDEINIAGFGQHLRLWRQRYGLSQSNLGQLVGYSASHINRIEKGTRRVSLFAIRTVFKPMLTHDETSHCLSTPCLESVSIISKNRGNRGE